MLGGETLRESDLICLWGGDEFIVIARQCRLEDGHRVADKLQRTIELTPLLGLAPGGEPPLWVVAGASMLFIGINGLVLGACRT